MDPRRAAALARLFEALQEGIYSGTIGPDSTSTVAANPHLKRMFGYPLEVAEADVRPFEPDRFVDPSARAALIEQLAANRAVSAYLLRLRRVDHRPIWIEVTATAGGSGREGRLRVDALLRDVTDRKKLADETREIYQQLVQAERMAALGQTISGVAHELNNPLATILSWTERLTSLPALDDAVREGLETILGESVRAARIVRNLLTFARKRQTTRAMVDLNGIVRQTLALRAYDQGASNVTVSDHLADGLPKVLADGHQIQQVLLNLVINAEQAMVSAHGRGVLTVRTRHDRDRDSIVLEVSDDGPGIPAAAVSKIFDPFFTTKEVGKGTGLGLTVAYAIIEEHGGRMRVESRPGGGASFHIELPVSGGALAADAGVGSRSAAPPVSTAGAALLVVEDEVSLATAVVDSLRDAGYLVEHARDGEAALEKVTAHSFDAVICDLKMPRLDGRAFHRTLERTAPRLARRLVFVTGDVAGTEAEAFLEHSGCRWLAKPFRLADLLRTVRDVLASPGS